MRSHNFFHVTFAFLLCVQFSAFAQKKAIFIIVDGIPADVIEKVATPTLDAIAGNKGYTRAYVGGEKGTYSETPTISAPGYMDLITATWANKHNVWDNDNQSPNYNYWNIFRIVETQKPDLHTAIFSTWLDNRTVLIGEGKAGDFTLDYAFDGFELDTVKFPHDDERQYILNIDEHVSTEAARYISEKSPDLSWVYLEYTDDMGHGFGDSEIFYESVRKADRQIAKIWNAIQARKTLGEDWLIVITTDHGRDAIKGMDHGDQSERERTTWMVTNAVALNEKFTKNDPPVIDITPSILKHLGISIPEHLIYEMDGTPFIGDISACDLKADLQGNNLVLHWKAFQKSGEAEILVSFSHEFKNGGKDLYEKIGSVALKKQTFQITLNEQQLKAYQQNGLIKVVLKCPLNTLNCWYKPKSEN
ncbi:MAG: alkaline phosphatase family protein [Microscillaceae bacterium]|nr:alkaline phosphatase family protein [Microscillaceae bacterium]